MSIEGLVHSLRIPFLILTPVCVLLGVSAAVTAGTEVDKGMLLLVFTGALFAHISVNTLNEYQDFVSGLDLITRRTPFSGGSGALPGKPSLAKPVFIIAISSFLVTILIGLLVSIKQGWEIIPPGLAGLVLIAAYTRWINRYPLLCLVAPGTGFGLLMVCGTQFALQGKVTVFAFILSLVPFFLVNNLLLLNQLPDIEADRTVGRNHLAIAYGIKIVALVYTGFALLTGGVIIYLVLSQLMVIYAIAALIPLSLTGRVAYAINRYGESIGQHPEYLAMNVVVTLLVLSILVMVTLLA